MKNAFLRAALAIAFALPAFPQTAILRIKILEGDGSVFAPGARSTSPLTVLVTDETGSPVAGAAVSFHLPEQGPGGTFLNGLPTSLSTTDGNGRASIRGLRLNRAAGPFQIRIVAAKDQARAGAVSNQYIAEAKAGASRADAKADGDGPRSHRKWVYIALGVAGAAGAGFVGYNRFAKTGATSSTSSVTIGAPVISIGGH